MRNNKYFKPTLIDKGDEEFIKNTFLIYVGFIIMLIAVILDQNEWNFISAIATFTISGLGYKIGYRIGRNLSSN